jgi:S-adenosylmethionine synthetase
MESSSSRDTRKLIDDKTKVFINPTGRFVIGGPVGDSGLTGRKIISGHLRRIRQPRRRQLFRKGPFQSGPFGSIHGPLWAKNIVAAGLGADAHIEVAYAIGVGSSRVGISTLRDQAFCRTYNYPIL